MQKSKELLSTNDIVLKDNEEYVKSSSTNTRKNSKDETKAQKNNESTSKKLSKYGGMYIEDSPNIENTECIKAKADDDAIEKLEAVANRVKVTNDDTKIPDEDVKILGVMLEKLREETEKTENRQTNYSVESEKYEIDHSETKNDRKINKNQIDEDEFIRVNIDNEVPDNFNKKVEEELINDIVVKRTSGLLEGMCPVTGNYLRSYESVSVKPKSNDELTEKEKNKSRKLEQLNQLLKEARSGTHIENSEITEKSLSKSAFSTEKQINVDRLAYMERGQIDPNELTTTSIKSVRLNRGWSTRMIRTLSNRNRKEDSDSEEDGADNCIFGNQIRFTIMIISTLCLSSILSNILTFNFTFICMAGPKPENFSNMTGEELASSDYRSDLDYDSIHRSALFMAVAVGAILAVFPLTILLNKFGSRLVFGALGYISAISTLLIPISANLGFGVMLIMRIIQGAGFSACLPVMGSITSHWSTLKQNGVFIAILSSFLQIAPIFTMPISGELCTSNYGWESVYYLHGVVCIIVFTVFICYHRNSPNKHPLILRKELVKVMFGKGSIYSGPGRQNRHSKKVPYWALYRDKAIWAIFVAAFGNFMGTQLSLQFMPTYINKVLFLPISQTGMASAISPIIMFFIKLIAGQSSDKIQFISDQWKLRIYNSLSVGGMGVFFIILAILNPVEQKSLCLVVLVISTCILGFNSGGFFKSSQMVSRQHSHFTLANISFINCVCMLIVPLLNELIAPENTPKTWAIVLCIHGSILLVTNAFFCFFCSSSPASWTFETWNNATTDERRSKKRKQSGNRVAPQRQSEIRRVSNKTKRDHLHDSGVNEL